MILNKLDKSSTEKFLFFVKIENSFFVLFLIKNFIFFWVMKGFNAAFFTIPVNLNNR